MNVSVEDLTPPTKDMTFLDMMNENDELMAAMMGLPEGVNESMVESRREKLFDMIWEETSMSREECLSLVEEREDDYIAMLREDEVDGLESIPEWMLRAEGQDVLLQIMHERIVEENVDEFEEDEIDF